MKTIFLGMAAKACPSQSMAKQHSIATLAKHHRHKNKAACLLHHRGTTSNTRAKHKNARVIFIFPHDAPRPRGCCAQLMSDRPDKDLHIRWRQAGRQQNHGGDYSRQKHELLSCFHCWPVVPAGPLLSTRAVYLLFMFTQTCLSRQHKEAKFCS